MPDISSDILSQAQQLLGPPVKIEAHRDWGIWWCPFHPDDARAGRGGHPNFGIHLGIGYWKCLRCDAAGPSLAALQKRLGVYRPPMHPVVATERRPRRTVTPLDEAVAEARAALMRSPAWAYIQNRGIRPYTALLYGLGYGLRNPRVGRETLQAARDAMLVYEKTGFWLWTEGVVYADPPAKPTIIQVRHRREGVSDHYQTWGAYGHPLGAWRVGAQTQIIVAVEGMFDMLMFAQALHDRNLVEVIPVYTANANVPWTMLDWVTQHCDRFGYVLVPDPDKGGEAWLKRMTQAIKKGKGVSLVANPPNGLDPDEALLAGWWPEGL